MLGLKPRPSSPDIGNDDSDPLIHIERLPEGCLVAYCGVKLLESTMVTGAVSTANDCQVCEEIRKIEIGWK